MASLKSATTLQEKSVDLHYDDIGKYYDENTDEYVSGWNSKHIHLGVFEPEDTHESLRETTKGPTLKHIEIICQGLNLQRGDFVLDAGCGVGGTVFHIAEKYQCQVVGLNISNHQIELAKNEAKTRGLQHQTRFEYVDCSSHLPFPDHSVDAIINIESACYYKDIQQFLKECFRVLKPGKFLGATDVMTKCDVNEEEYESFVEPIIKSWFLSQLFSIDQYKKILTEVGFEVTHARYVENTKRNIFYFRRNLNNIIAICRGKIDLLPPKKRMVYEQIKALLHAWENGFFELGHYLARKTN